jgi:hypothetical protein
MVRANIVSRIGTAGPACFGHARRHSKRRA